MLAHFFRARLLSRLIIACLALLTVAQTALAQTTALYQLKEDYCGHFIWDSDTDEDHQEIRFQFSGLNMIENNIFISKGSGTYFTNPRTDIDIEARISLNSGRIEIYESNPNSLFFITDGKHVGTITSDGLQINARWQNRSGRELRTLFLEVCEQDVIS